MLLFLLLWLRGRKKKKRATTTIITIIIYCHINRPIDSIGLCPLIVFDCIVSLHVTGNIIIIFYIFPITISKAIQN